jgi:hypothetical protein
VRLSGLTLAPGAAWRAAGPPATKPAHPRFAGTAAATNARTRAQCQELPDEVILYGTAQRVLQVLYDRWVAGIARAPMLLISGAFAGASSELFDFHDRRMRRLKWLMENHAGVGAQRPRHFAEHACSP